MNKLLLLPILVPFVTAILCIFLWRKTGIQRILSLLGAACLLISAVVLDSAVWHLGIQSTQLGNWPAPFGITVVCDLFSAVMVTLAAIVGLTVMVFSLETIDEKRESFGYYPLLNILLMGICGAFLTGDIFNLYVWFEVMLIASFVLLELGGERAQLEGAVKYVTLNLMSSALFLTGVAILYGISGSLNMAEISVRLSRGADPGLVNAVAVMFFLAFGIKAAAFPLFFWLPASYHTPPSPVSAFFGGLLTKVGVYALIRVFTLMFIQEPLHIHKVILICGGFTMLTGVLGAMSQMDFRRLLSFHIISQVGYMLMGLGLFTHLALTGTVFFMAHNIVAKTNLFFVSGITYRLKGTYDLKRLGGIYTSYPLLSLLFFISAFALAGIPPLSGFWAKFILIKAGIVEKNFIIAAVALVVSLFTLYSMTKIWNEVFWKKAPDQNSIPDEVPGASAKSRVWVMLLPVIFMAALNVAMGVFAQSAVEIAGKAAAQLMDPSAYIRTVLGGGFS
jgi:multicomponent Na+:H+ antiporter subunit D